MTPVSGGPANQGLPIAGAYRSTWESEHTSHNALSFQDLRHFHCIETTPLEVTASVTEGQHIYSRT
jgi:hypothetical protein